MKKIITTLFLISVAIVGSSQSIRLIFEGQDVSNEIVDVYVAPNTSNISDLTVNNSSEMLFDTVAIARTIYTKDTSDNANFAWVGFFYSYYTNHSHYSADLAPGDSIDSNHNGFRAYFTAGPTTITRLIHYLFYDINRPDIDSTGVTIRYNYSEVGINESSKITNTISDAYPNPASSSVSFSYTINAPSQKGIIVFYDVLGKAVKETVLDQKQDIVNINISDLTTGLYFYKFMVNDNVISTKKLVVSSK